MRNSEEEIKGKRDIVDFDTYIEQKFYQNKKILPAIEVILSKKEFNVNDPGYQKPILSIDQADPLDIAVNECEY